MNPGRGAHALDCHACGNAKSCHLPGCAGTLRRNESDNVLGSVGLHEAQQESQQDHCGHCLAHAQVTQRHPHAPIMTATPPGGPAMPECTRGMSALCRCAYELRSTPCSGPSPRETSSPEAKGPQHMQEETDFREALFPRAVIESLCQGVLCGDCDSHSCEQVLDIQQRTARLPKAQGLPEQRHLVAHSMRCRRPLPRAPSEAARTPRRILQDSEDSMGQLQLHCYTPRARTCS